MNKFVHDFVDFIESQKGVNTKEAMVNLVNAKFHMTKDGRALYHTDYLAVVFCYTKNDTFSNVVLSLSKLEKYDRIPCFVVLVKRAGDNAIYLMNTTFLNKISHSSRDLRVDNIRGSILGSNIRKEIEELDMENTATNFDDLFIYHKSFNWKENLERLVESTNQIKPAKEKTILDGKELINLYASPARAKRFVQSNDYKALLADLRERCEDAKEAIMTAAHIENVNIRGRLIEALITSDQKERTQLLRSLHDIEHLLPVYDTANKLGDYERHFDNADTYTDIKTKILYLDSCPKAYNIDKFLKVMGESKSIFMFFFVGVDIEGGIKTILCSVFHKKLMENTCFEHHWAGRATRGTAQFRGKTINELLLSDNNFCNQIDDNASESFLKKLLNR